MVITSTTNQKIKTLRELYRDKKARYAAGEYIAEGVTIVKDLDESRIARLFVRESDADRWSDLGETYYVRDGIFDAVADTKTPSGVIAVCKMPEPREVRGDLVMVLCGVSDAGNVGTIMRTACARGVDTVVCVDTADPYSPKAVRASMGGINKLNIVICDGSDLKNILSGYKLVVLDMGGICIRGYQQVGKIALVVGNEAHGVAENIKSIADESVSIPMAKDSVESLNAAVAASIAMYFVG